MNKTRPTVGRLLVMAGFALSCFVLLLGLWLVFGGAIPFKPQGYRVTVPFPEAQQLAAEADVRISGVPVGKVKSLEPDPATGRTNAVVEIEADFAPLPLDVRAILRQKTLLGETYVELTPGSRGGQRLAEGGQLPVAQVAETVELDEIFRALDPQTRERLQTWLQQQALAGEGRGADVSEAIGTLPLLAQDARSLLTLLDEQAPQVRSAVADTSEVLAALTDRRGSLQQLVTSGELVFSTTGAGAADLRETIAALPGFQREATGTVDRLERFARDTDPLVRALRPAARAATPTLQGLQRAAPDLRGLLADVEPLSEAAERGLPATQRTLDELRPLLGAVDAPLAQLEPLLGHLGRHRDDLRAFFSNSAAATQATTGDGDDRVHYLRTTNPLSPENLANFATRLPTNRSSPYRPSGWARRLGSGLPSFETRQCGRGSVPPLDQEALEARGMGQLGKDLQELAYAGTTTPPAPPCVQQGPQDGGGLFPQVAARR